MMNSLTTCPECSGKMQGTQRKMFRSYSEFRYYGHGVTEEVILFSVYSVIDLGVLVENHPLIV